MTLHDHTCCAHAQAQASRAQDALQQAERVCQNKGVRLTTLRRKVLEALYATHKALGAYELAERIETGPKRAAPITIYRVLEFLLEHGLIHRLESRNAYIACPHQHRPNEPIVFLMCETCGGVDETSHGDLRKAIEGLVQKAGFTPNSQMMEISGICEHCRGR